MKKFVFGVVATFTALFVSVAADIPWPADFDCNVAARDMAREDGGTVADVTFGAVDARQRDGKECSYEGIFCGTLFDMYVSAGAEFDPEASLGFSIILR